MSKEHVFTAIIVAVIVTSVVTVLLRSEALDKHDTIKLQLDSIRHERDSLQFLFESSRLREEQYILRHEADSIKAMNQEASITARESKLKTYKQRVDEINKIIIQRPDSFLIRRYGN